jgi:hypothetical protein
MGGIAMRRSRAPGHRVATGAGGASGAIRHRQRTDRRHHHGMVESDVRAMRPKLPRRHRRLAVLVAATLAVIVAVPAPVVADGPTPPTGDYPWMCHYDDAATPEAVTAAADQLLAGTYPELGGMTLGLDLRWTEDPIHDRNWRLREHTTRFVLDLVEAWHLTGNLAYRTRALELLLDWGADNPRSAPPSEFSWNDQATGLRATVLACADRELDPGGALGPLLLAHGRLLADPGFYKGYGNHALDQSIGLLDVAVRLDRHDWRDLAISRMGSLLAASVDSQGVTNEQAIAYEWHNYQRYATARRRIGDLGLAIPSVFARIDRMPEFLAQATLPDGYYEMIGDTDRQRAEVIPGTAAEFAATRGATGTPPAATVSFYTAGYLFARSGWGVRRAYGDEVDLSLHYGPPRYIHGHDDQGSLTLYGYGSRLLLDPGKYSYNMDRWQYFFRSRAAHNVVTADGLTWRGSKGMSLVSKTVGSRVVDARLAGYGYAGVSLRRRVTYSRRLDWIVVEDRITSTTTRTFRQLWHLAPGSAPTVSGSSVRTHRARGNLLIRQLSGSSTVRVLSGRTSPIQGWQSDTYLHKTPAPTVEFARRGRSIRYLTLIVPGAASPRVSVSGLVSLSGGYQMTITVNGHSERVRANGSSVAVWTP